MASCTGEPNADADKMGRLTVQLTDAPFPFELVAEANVTIFKVEARKSDDHEDEDSEAGDENDDDMENGNDSPFVVLMEDEIDVNLLELTNGTTEMLADIEVPVGTYDLVRVYVRGVNVVLTDGRVFDLKVPSGEQTGIKIFIKPGITVAGGLSADLLLDFDVSRSFIAKGNTKSVNGIHGFNFKPVIKACNISTAGSLTGLVSTWEDENEVPLEGAQISVWAADTLNTSGFTDADGKYTIMGLEAGTYKVFSALEGYINSDTLDVEIVVANKTIQDFQLEKEVIEDPEN
ncbi:DUF4382 domain-containing protein [Flagellimonas myxillae]|uniref:DUF4382 domain-containing protein n=1 Tax=Flagellimonas myxillae TaxID=2942214 RepID=UPI00201F78E7|nr:DUF4382 domain-containing protein [Muricauda myxillae]MCL6265495.1 DUF4382 domain-containing protein [Muricauda myxillae]